MAKTGELAVNFEIWNERPGICENLTCTNRIDTFAEANMHHIKTKGAEPARRLDKNNIILLCYECHQKAHQKGNSAIQIPPEYKED